jgi:hypothetical protein
MLAQEYAAMARAVSPPEAATAAATCAATPAAMPTNMPAETMPAAMPAVERALPARYEARHDVAFDAKYAPVLSRRSPKSPPFAESLSNKMRRHLNQDLGTLRR